LFFGNAEALFGTIATAARSKPATVNLVVSLEETFELDSTALDALIEFDREMQGMGKKIIYARVHDRVRDILVAAGAAAIVGRSRYSVDDAVAAAARP
jgi:anti-anti-sigma regulatory factor